MPFKGAVRLLMVHLPESSVLAAKAYAAYRANSGKQFFP